MDRQRSQLDIIGKLQRSIADAHSQLKTLRNQNLALPDWIYVGTAGAPAFQNSWTVPYPGVWNAPAFWKDSSGVVRLGGLISGGILNTTMFTLPVGFRPSSIGSGNGRIFVVSAGSNFGELRVLDSGNVLLNVGLVSSWISLDGVSFRAEN